MLSSYARLVCGSLAVLALLACGAQGSPSRVRAKAAAKAQLSARGLPRIAVVMMENSEYGRIIGSPDAPYINGLARTYALATAMYANTHPSLPNYLAFTGGSTFGINSDCTDCSVSSTGLVDQLARGHISWKAYMEGLPHRCFTGAGAGDYVKRHDPFVYYDSVVTDPKRCAQVVPLTELSSDERRHALPAFVWITPNLCHDMHDCSTATGDHFLARLIPPLLHALGSRGLLVLTWDEGSSNSGCCQLASGGHIAMILAGALSRRGARMTTPVDHYSVLRTIEDLFGLPRLRNAACACTPSLQRLLRR